MNRIIVVLVAVSILAFAGTACYAQDQKPQTAQAPEVTTEQAQATAVEQAPQVVTEQAPVVTEEAPAATEKAPAAAGKSIKGIINEVSTEGNYVIVEKQKIIVPAELMEYWYLEPGDKVEIFIEESPEGPKAADYEFIYEEEAMPAETMKPVETPTTEAPVNVEE